MKQKSNSATAPQTGDSGFSLIEMLVVLVIISSVMVAASSSMVWRDNTPSPADVASAVQRLFYRARIDAMSSGVPSTAWIDTRSKTIGYSREPVIRLSDTASMKITTARELMDETGKVRLVFLPDGSSSGMDIRFADHEKTEAVLSVNWLTGLPRVEGSN